MTNEEAMTVLRGLLDRAKKQHTTKRAKMQRILDAGKTPSASMRVDVERAEYTVQQATAAVGHLYALLDAPAADSEHWCSYECERPACIRAQRDELASRLAAETSNARGEVVAWMCISADGLRSATDNPNARDNYAKAGRTIRPLTYADTAPPPSAPVGVEWVQEQLPRRVESASFGNLDAEQLSIFDNGYNAALTRAHNILSEASSALANGGCPTARGSAFGGPQEAALAQQPSVAPVGVEGLAQEIRRIDGRHSLGAGALAEALMPFLASQAAQQPAAVDETWRQKAAEWLEAKAVEQEANNQRWPDHAAAYKEWRDRPGVLRYLAAQVLATQHQEPTT